MILVLICTNITFSQRMKIEKANKDYDKFAYIDARKIYLRVVEQGYDSAEIYKKLGDTYYFNDDYINASIWYGKLINKYPDDAELEYYYRAAQSYKSIDKYEESDELMEIYITLGGKDHNINVFGNDPKYLKSIGVQTKRYEIDKVQTNTKYSDFGPSYYMDKLVFASSSRDLKNFKSDNWNNLPYLNLYVADIDEYGALSNLKPLGGEINTKYHESSAVFTKDGKTVYFTRNNYLNGRRETGKNRTLRLKLYRAEKDGDNSWTNVIDLPFNSKEYSVSHPALSKDEKRLYFASNMPGTFGRSDIWYVNILGNNRYSKPINLGESINTKARESFTFISENNNLYFASDGHGGSGGFDIFTTHLDEKGNFDKISNIGKPINSNQDDFGFIIKESEGTGYFSSNKDGGRGSIDDEIYHFVEKCVITISGVVTDEITGELLPGTEVSILDNNNKLLEKVAVGNNGIYSFMIECDLLYIIHGTKKDYFPIEKIVEMPDESGVIILDLQLKPTDPCPPNDLGCRLNLMPIYFDFDRFNIRSDATIELAKILVALQEYPELIIHIESHTDSRGSDSYNESLSEKRARATLKWFVEQGINYSRLSSKGYGEFQLINQCSNGEECDDEEHQLNRRSMFIIQN